VCISNSWITLTLTSCYETALHQTCDNTSATDYKVLTAALLYHAQLSALTICPLCKSGIIIFRYHSKACMQLPISDWYSNIGTLAYFQRH